MSTYLVTATVQLKSTVDASTRGQAERYAKNHIDLTAPEGFGWTVEEMQVAAERVDG